MLQAVIRIIFNCSVKESAYMKDVRITYNSRITTVLFLTNMI
jgi:hypothetical protein